MPRDSDTDYDARVGRAINRVLETERVAQSEIAASATQAEESLERARQQRRSILERTQARIIALHARAARAFERQASLIHPQPGYTEPDAAAGQAERARSLAAIARLAEGLTSDRHEG